ELVVDVGSANISGGEQGFDDIKAAHFGTAAERARPNAGAVLGAKRLAFRYGLFIHEIAGSDVSGVGEIRGNDFVVALGSVPACVGHPRGTVDMQAGTFMHELGHTLNLQHGGADDINCKPNYLSVMSYTRQIDGLPVDGRELDYSRAALATLDESN